MSLLFLGIYKWADKSCIEVSRCGDASSVPYVQRGSALKSWRRQALLYAGMTQLGKTQTDDLENDSSQCHTWVNPQGLATAVIVTQDYPARVARQLAEEVSKVFMETKA